MPKRFGKNTNIFNHGFHHGFAMGKSLAFLSIQVHTLRTNKKLTVSEFAVAAGVPEWVVEGVEACDCNVYIKTDIDHYTAIAKFCDVAVEIKFVATSDTSMTASSIPVKTFEEEYITTTIND